MEGFLAPCGVGVQGKLKQVTGRSPSALNGFENFVKEIIIVCRVQDVFKAVVKEVCKKRDGDKDSTLDSSEYDDRKCDDQLIGLLQIERGNARLCKWIRIALNHDDLCARIDVHQSLTDEKQYPILAIVLESPHIEEFSKEEGGAERKRLETPMPALGDTGQNIFSLLPKYINRIDATFEEKDLSRGIGYPDIPSGIYRVLLINAIQYQCSLGADTNKHRTTVFNKMWEKEEVRENFKERIPFATKVVINACTNGGCRPSLREKIQKAIDERVADDCVKLHAYHPSTWKKCIGIEPDGWDN